jgi:hypothetical protein
MSLVQSSSGAGSKLGNLFTGKYKKWIYLLVAIAVLYFVWKYSQGRTVPPPLTHGSLLLDGKSTSVTLPAGGTGSLKWVASKETPAAKVQLFWGPTTDPTKAKPSSVPGSENAASALGVAQGTFHVSSAKASFYVFACDLTAAANKTPAFSNPVQVVVS